MNAGLANVFNLSGELCIHADQNGIFWSRTGATPPNNREPVDWLRGSYGMGAGAGLKIELSDAETKDDLAGPFKFGEGSFGPGQGGYAWGKGNDGHRNVHVLSGGYSAGVPSGAGGLSQTVVEDNYLWRFPL